MTILILSIRSIEDYCAAQFAAIANADPSESVPIDKMLRKCGVSRAEQGHTKAGRVLLTDDFASPPVLDLNQISAKFYPSSPCSKHSMSNSVKGRRFPLGEHLHLFMLAVDGEFAGRGIGQGLVKACLDDGFQKGYRRALTEAMGRVSQHVFRKQGFVDRFSVSYRDFRYEGKAVFLRFGAMRARP